MIERFRLWLRLWLHFDEYASAINDLHASEKRYDSAIGLMQTQIAELRAEVTRLQLERYVPPQTPEEPKKKIVKTQTFKQFSDIVEQEMESQYADG